jgi:hypothetical protein
MRNFELHFHLLPCVDAGPVSVDESVPLARAAVEDGPRTIIATPHVSPHWPTDATTIAERVADLAARPRRERIPIEVHPGAELHYEMSRVLRRQSWSWSRKDRRRGGGCYSRHRCRVLTGASMTPATSYGRAGFASWSRTPIDQPGGSQKIGAYSPTNSRLAALCS